MKRYLSIVAVMALSLNMASAKVFNIDKAHSSVGFEVKHLLISKVNGEFNNFSGTLDINPSTKKINKLEGNIVINSIDTKNKKRDDHLNTVDFFNSAKFQTGTFVMTKQDGDKIYGNLTLNGVTKPVIWEVEMNGPVNHPMTKKQLMALDIEGKINRKDFNIGTSFASNTVSDEIKVSIQIEASE